MLKTIKEKSREDLLKENEDLYSRLQQLRGEMESYRQAYWRLVKKIESLQIETVLKGGNENDK
jgi:uncharacterized protein (DUF3084 family)|tara:strand:+ start:110 stop:298 length:189 start_codon:yes stop_codon:yes gene_type:complete